MFKVCIYQANFNVVWKYRGCLEFFKTLTSSKIPCNREVIHFMDMENGCIFAKGRRHYSSIFFFNAPLQVRSLENRAGITMF